MLTVTITIISSQDSGSKTRKLLFLNQNFALLVCFSNFIFKQFYKSINQNTAKMQKRKNQVAKLTQTLITSRQQQRQMSLQHQGDAETKKTGDFIFQLYSFLLSPGKHIWKQDLKNRLGLGGGEFSIAEHEYITQKITHSVFHRSTSLIILKRLGLVLLVRKKKEEDKIWTVTKQLIF